MPTKENNCKCVVCQVEQSLLDSLSTQTARIHFQALAANHPVLNHFDSPADVIARLHDHEEVEALNHIAWDGILHALVNGLADRTTEDIGQQLLLVAYTPAIHKVYREICQQFPGLASEDIAQQASLCLLETAKSPEMHRLNGQLPLALVNRFRQSLFRWAIKESRQSLPLQQGSLDQGEPPVPSSFERTVALEKFLQQARRDGLLSEADYQLLLKFKWEGFGAKELAPGKTGSKTPNAMHHRLKRIVKRLRMGVRGRHLTKTEDAGAISPHPENIFQNTRPISPGSCAFRKSEKGFSPELSHHVPQFEPDITQTAP